jgi:hypothetical protein
VQLKITALTLTAEKYSINVDRPAPVFKAALFIMPDDTSFK